MKIQKKGVYMKLSSFAFCLSLACTVPAIAATPTDSFYKDFIEEAVEAFSTEISLKELKDKSKLGWVKEQVVKSIDISKLHSEIDPCLEKLPESQWNSSRKCTEPIVRTVFGRIGKYTALANAGFSESGANKDKAAVEEKLTSDSPAMTKEDKMNQTYAAMLLLQMATARMNALVANKRINYKDKNPKDNVACGATLIADPNQRVFVKFLDTCVPMEKNPDFSLSLETIKSLIPQLNDNYNFRCKDNWCVSEPK